MTEPTNTAQSAPTPEQQMIVAIAHLIQWTGAEQFQVRYSDDERPIVWFCVAAYPGGRYETDAALTPEQAAWRLAERLIDGGRCVHCHRPTALTEGEDDLTDNPFIKADKLPLCQYRYRAGKVVRGCDSMPVGSPRKSAQS